jgi:hypothetical protein
MVSTVASETDRFEEVMARPQTTRVSLCLMLGSRSAADRGDLAVASHQIRLYGPWWTCAHLVSSGRHGVRLGFVISVPKKVAPVFNVWNACRTDALLRGPIDADDGKMSLGLCEQARRNVPVQVNTHLLYKPGDDSKHHALETDYNALKADSRILEHVFMRGVLSPDRDDFVQYRQNAIHNADNLCELHSAIFDAVSAIHGLSWWLRRTSIGNRTWQDPEC